ncbi:nose resistant to fluoxetine protein 6-like [Topomyia yanbarensis]|uniref:nose resistant to fluoxetine protein 6-like n=1 Tax=Topomyia yanbarensis TaxID=2498891 RepID=UPI00273B98F7|nr:nose resistant to fluoxetine protein 6-like [Topomyia yanbarensis]
MVSKVLYICLIGLSLVVIVNGEYFDLQQYHRMPKLSEFDDYDQCMEEAPVGTVATYCMIRLVIEPDNSSELWHMIEAFSIDRRHYNHRHLVRGVCVERCKQLVYGLPNTTQQMLKVDKFEIDYPYIFDVSVFKDTYKNRDRYGELLEVCLNYKLNQTYQLKAYTEIEVCDRNDEASETDLLDMLFVIVFVVVISLVVLSSWYDKSINFKQDVVHYKMDVNSKRKMVYVSFSILRNWYRLTSRSSESLHKDLRFLQAIRFFTMMFVIMGHAALLNSIIPTQNTSQLELMYHRIGTMILTGGVQITQSFLSISGALVAIHVMTYAERSSNKIGIPFLLKATIYRYIRLTPVYAFIILLHATWLVKMQNGPIWKQGSETEKAFCRRNWWTNLLYVNNYVNADQPCVQQGWYLGCDYQLFIAGTLLLILINRFRRFLIPIVTLASIGSYVLPALFIYYQKLEGVFVITLEAQRFVLWFDQFYLKSYIPFHVNTGNFLGGMITGLLYMHLKKRNVNPVQKLWFRILWYLVIPLSLASMLVHYIFYVNDFEKPSIWMAIYFPVMKNSWAFFSCIFVLGFINGIAPMLQRIFNQRIFEPLGRLTYSAYLAHVFVMRLIILSIRSPAHFNYLAMITITFASLVFSYLMAMFLCLTLELPVSALQKHMLGPLRGDGGKQLDSEVNIAVVKEQIQNGSPKTISGTREH